MGMARFINLDKALQRLAKEIWWTESQKSAIRLFLYKSKEVDVVPVVRCKDCKHYLESEHPERKGIKFCYRLKDRNGEHIGYNYSDDDFCSYGERREGE